jgi:4a-hydroxytetrahydrobiopterin dehydratase
MLNGEAITAAGLGDWRKLGQGLHARYVVPDLEAAARFLAVVAYLDPAMADHLHAHVGKGVVDLKLVSEDAVYRDDEGTEHQVDWVTQTDIDLARRISEVAAELSLTADPRSLVAIELALDTAGSTALAPIWSILLTGGTEAVGRGTIGDDVRDGAGRVPILWFQETEPHPTPRQRFHVDIQVPYDVAAERIAAAVAAGATVVDDSRAPWTTILADPDGNKACVGTFQPAP